MCCLTLNGTPLRAPAAACPLTACLVRPAEQDLQVVIIVSTGGGGTLIWPWDKFVNRLVEMVMWWQEWQRASEVCPRPHLRCVPVLWDAW